MGLVGSSAPAEGRDISILLDFELRAIGTVNLLETTSLHCPEVVFNPLRTNKFYGDAPNEIPLKELETRWVYVRDRKTRVTVPVAEGFRRLLSPFLQTCTGQAGSLLGVFCQLLVPSSSSFRLPIAPRAALYFPNRLPCSPALLHLQ